MKEHFLAGVICHSVMLYKTLSTRAQIKWKISKAKTNDSMEMRLVLHTVV